MEADWYSHFAKESLYVTYIQGNWGGGGNFWNANEPFKLINFEWLPQIEK